MEGDVALKMASFPATHWSFMKTNTAANCWQGGGRGAFSGDGTGWDRELRRQQLVGAVGPAGTGQRGFVESLLKSHSIVQHLVSHAEGQLESPSASYRAGTYPLPLSLSI